MCAASITVAVGDDASVRMWTNCWASVGPLHRFAPSLFAATSRAGRKRTLREAVLDNQWARDVSGALTVQVLREYLEVWEILRSVQLQVH